MALEAEAFQGVAAATGLLNIATRTLGRLRKAHARQKTLIEVLDQHECELKSIGDIIDIVDDEPSLKTATVASELSRLKMVEDKLVELLKELDIRSKGTVTQITYQLLHGSSEEKKLAAIMSELCQVKSALLLRIQVASVGVMQTVGDIVLANAAAIARIDSLLKEKFGDGRGLKIARLLQGRSPRSDGNVPLTLNELASLSGGDDGEDETLIGDMSSNESSNGGPKAKAKPRRDIIGNLTQDQAMQINGPIGEDLWAHISHIKVGGNTAKDNSMQVNYAMSREDFY